MGGSSPFGASTPAFGAPASTPAFGGFGATASTPAFGAPASTPAFGSGSTFGGGFGVSGSDQLAHGMFIRSAD